MPGTQMPGAWDFVAEDGELDEGIMTLEHATLWSLMPIDLGSPLALSTTIELDKSQPPTPDGTGLPVNFQTIGPGIFRCSYPQVSHFAALEGYGFKTIVTLVSGETPPETQAFITKHGITHHMIHVVANKDPEIYASHETITSILRFMLNRENHPILIHCNKGKHRTGCVSAIFRRCTGWSLDACIAEYEKYAYPKARELDKSFITRFDVKELKALALQEGFVTEAWGPQHSMTVSSNASAYTNPTTISSASTSTLNISKSLEQHELDGDEVDFLL